MTRLLGLLLMLVVCGAAIARGGAVSLQLPVGEVEIPVTRHLAPGRDLVLWLPSEHGVQPAEQAMAAHLAEQGYETWVADLYGGRFLPATASSAEELPAQDVYGLIRAAFRHKRQIWLVTAGRGAKYTLEGARLWQRRAGRAQPLAGTVLLYPNLYARQPEPGADPAYLPITGQTRLRIHILQGELSPWYWTLDSLRAELARGGSVVSVQTLPGIRDRFHFREDATPAERALAARLPQLLVESIRTSVTGSRP